MFFTIEDSTISLCSHHCKTELKSVAIRANIATLIEYELFKNKNNRERTRKLKISDSITWSEKSK